jgi:hypothetical protein
MATIEKTTKAQLVREAILLCADVDGSIRSEAVFEAAKNPNNILHGEFVWDGNEAIQQLGLQRAAQLIRSVRIEVIVDSIKLISPKFVSSPASNEGGNYISIDTLRHSTPSIKHGVLLDEITRIEANIKRAMAIAGALDVIPELMELFDTVSVIKTRIKE